MRLLAIRWYVGTRTMTTEKRHGSDQKNQDNEDCAEDLYLTWRAH